MVFFLTTFYVLLSINSLVATLYTHRAENIRRTWLLLGAFVSLIALIGWALSYALDTYYIFPLAVGLSVFMSIMSYWFSDKMVIALSGAKPLKKEDDLELYRLVENLSITAGLPMPKLYMIEDVSLNAFATGRNAKNAVVAVTRGLRERLERSELEGVLAHELAHIGNRDMLVATIVAVLAGVIVTLVDIALRMTFYGGMGRDRRGAGPIMLGVLVLVLILAPIAATLLRLGVSRRREFLADTSGVLLTRYPEGLARALEKISATATPMRKNPDAIAHLWLSDPDGVKGPKRRSRLGGLFLTHPHPEDRIRALREMSV